MIKILKATYLHDYVLKLEFSDASYANYDFSYLLKKNTSLTNVLNEVEYFQSYFLELGALCWSNGLELSPNSLYQKAQEQDILYRDEEVA